MREPFPELEELIEHLTTPEMIGQRIQQEKLIMAAVWELRFWESING